MALANHRKAIRSEIAGLRRAFRDMEESAVTLALQAHGVDIARVPAGGDVDDRGQPGPHPGARTAASASPADTPKPGAFIERYLERFEVPAQRDDGSEQP